MISPIKQWVATKLRWSERYTKTDMIYLARGSFWLMAGQAAGMVITLGLAVAFSHLASKEAYGTYRFLLSLSSLISIASLTGIATALIQTTGKGVKGILGVAVKESLVWGAGTVAVGVVVAAYYLTKGNEQLALGLLIIALGTPLLRSVNLYLSYLNGLKQYATHTLFSTLQSFVNALALIGLLLITDSPLLLVSVFFVGQIVVGAVGVVHALYQQKTSAPAEEIRSFKGYARQRSMVNAISVIGNNIDSVIIFHYLGAAPVAIYYFATAIPNQLNGVVKNFYTLALPRFSKYDRTVVRATLARKIVLLAATSIVLTAAYIVSAPYIFKILFPQYMDSLRYSQWFALNIMITGAMVSYTAFFEAQRALREQYITTTLNAVSRIVLMIALTPTFGLIGIIAAYLVSRCLTLLSSIILTHR